MDLLLTYQWYRKLHRLRERRSQGPEAKRLKREAQEEMATEAADSSPENVTWRSAVAGRSRCGAEATLGEWLDLGEAKSA
ncbi:unnamed protein product [Effrenium voratum]|nr:unnamed protein product [Effrenium voratum]